MVFTLHRYIFRELFRVFLLTTIALTLMLSLGSMIGPIQKFGVGPSQAVHLLGYLVPITLTFVMPMGALLAVALIYGRFASDNELNACRASGISLTTLIYPGLCLAVAVSIATIVLSFHVVPAFVKRAEKSTQANAKQILFRNIQRKGYYELPGERNRFRIYAERAIIADEMLEGVIIVESTKTGNFAKLITAEAAKVKINTEKKFNEVTVVARETYQLDEQGQAYSKNLPISGTFESLLIESIKFQDLEELKKIKDDMIRFYPIRKLALVARDQLTSELLSEHISEKVNDPGQSYYQLETEDMIVQLTAQQCVPKTDQTIELIGPIRVVEYEKVLRRLMHQWDAPEGFLKLQGSSTNPELVMVLKNTQWQRADEIKGIAERHVVRNITVPKEVTDKIDDKNLLAAIRNIPSILALPTDYLKGLANGIAVEIESTSNEIIAEINSRLVMGIGCIMLILTSIALGIIFKGSHLLTAFGISTIPAGLLMACVMAGKRLTKNPATPAITGVMVMWAGLIVLSIVTIIIYRKLTRT